MEGDEDVQCGARRLCSVESIRDVACGVNKDVQCGVR